jgi:type II secretion system (T2SS) protein E
MDAITSRAEHDWTDDTRPPAAERRDVLRDPGAVEPSQPAAAWAPARLEIDYRLFSYIPLELAWRETILPIRLDGDTLTVAAADTDPDLSETAACFPGLALELVVEPAQAIRETLRAATRDLSRGPRKAGVAA